MTWFAIALLSAFLSAGAAITQKKVLSTIGALEFSFLLSVVNLVFSIPFFFFIDYETINSANLTILFLKSVIGVGAFFCVMLSLKNLEISNALPLLALTPGFIAVFAFFLLGESLKSLEVVGLILLMLGTFILESRNGNKFILPFRILIKSKYHRYVIFALLLFTASSLLDKLLLVKLNLSPISLTAFQHLYFAVLFGIVFLVFNKKLEATKQFITKNNLLWVAFISVLTIGYRFTQVAAVGMASVALVLAIKRTSVFWATIIGGKIFNDKDLLKRSLAAILIVIGAILILRD
ncbi:MAG: EamA family transporter [Ignavibacteriaceae bacterium]|nr:EamA family transporter [Ignavibacteriaceae bacterium]